MKNLKFYDKFVVVLLLAVVCGYATARLHYDWMRIRGIAEVAMQEHRAWVEGKGMNPGQYRVMSEFMVEGLRVWTGEHWPVRAMFGVHVLLCMGIAVVFVFYLRALGVSFEMSLVGLTLWTMGFLPGVRFGTWFFSTWFDILFYLLASWAIVKRRYWWTVPIVVVAGLNRETSGVIPFLCASALLWDKGSSRTIFKASVVAVAVWLAEFVFLRLWFPAQSFQGGYRRLLPGLPLLTNNLTNLLGWSTLVCTLGFVWLLALWRYRDWPVVLRGFFWVMVPVWVVAHTLGGNFTESRLFFVPQLVVFIPCFLVTLDQWRKDKCVDW